MSSPAAEPVTLARNAMATRFEIVLHGDNPVALRAAGEEALTEIERLEGQLSLYRNTSEIAHLNARAAREPVRVSPALFRVLERARSLSDETEGAFDISIAPLVRCWGFMGDTGHMPSRGAVEEARSKVGMNLVELNPSDFTVRFACEGVMLDLGAIGKGYAIDQAAGLLREAGVTSALLHGGTSSVYAIGHPPEAENWKVAIEQPQEGRTGVSPLPTRSDNSAGSEPAVPGQPENRQDALPALLAVVPLIDEALSVSAVWGKIFQTADKTFGHVIDPRTGYPVDRALLSAVVLPSTTETDALSTALLTEGSDGLRRLTACHPTARCLVVSGSERRLQIHASGIECGGP
jgi:thiamine biosynthesis lipoprotein